MKLWQLYVVTLAVVLLTLFALSSLQTAGAPSSLRERCKVPDSADAKTACREVGL